MTCEVRDTVDIVKWYDGLFNVTLLDVEKYQYMNGFEIIREKI